MAPSPSMRNWCFTKYDLSMPEFDPAVVRYCVYQKEICPDTGREHLQGYIEFKKSIRLRAVKTLFGDQTMHLERRSGTRDQARDYCMKEDSRAPGTLPVEFGEWDSRQGRRSDLEQVYEAIKDGKVRDQIREEYPLEYMKYSRAINEMIQHRINLTERRAMEEDYDDITLHPWQQDCITDIQNQNDRKVLWITDPEGGKGKTFLTKYLKVKYNALVVTGGKADDIAYQYNWEKIVVFDLARKSEFMPYQLIENFKNGLIFSPKWESQMKFSKNVKVVVFSNEPPDLNRLSLDRWMTKTI